MRFPHQVLIVVSDAERPMAQQLAVQELGPERGANWLSVRLEDAEGALHWASCTAFTAANLETINWFQSTPLALASLVVRSANRELGEELDVAAELAQLGLQLAPEPEPDPTPEEEPQP